MAWPSARAAIKDQSARSKEGAVVGESILDRVLNTSHHLLLDGKSYRPRRRPGRSGPGPAAARPP